MQFKIAKRLQRVEPSPSIVAAQRARELRAQGRDIIALSTGEPDFPTPAHIIEAAAAAATGAAAAGIEGLVLGAHGGRGVLVLDVERRQRARQLVRHGDDGAGEIDGAGDRRRRGGGRRGGRPRCRAPHACRGPLVRPRAGLRGVLRRRHRCVGRVRCGGWRRLGCSRSVLRHRPRMRLVPPVIEDECPPGAPLGTEGRREGVGELLRISERGDDRDVQIGGKPQKVAERLVPRLGEPIAREQVRHSADARSPL